MIIIIIIMIIIIKIIIIIIMIIIIEFVCYISYNTVLLYIDQNFSSCINKVLIFFRILVLQEYWVLKESRISLAGARGCEDYCIFH